MNALATPARIRLLPPDVVARIAAGEVVERPASVVKELAENALDAGAARIDVEILGGGREQVRVSDDGSGMPPADLAACVLSHATSKLTQAEDLETLGTLGFRGEALPSIGAVSKLTITSRARPAPMGLGGGLGGLGGLGGGDPGAEADSAWRIDVHGGQPEKPEPQPAAGPYGSTVDVRALFYNLPARAKFLKGPASEAAACADTLLRLALTRPDVAFTLRQGAHEIFHLPARSGRDTDPAARLPRPAGHAAPAAPLNAILQRARDVLGRDNAAGMVEIAVDGPRASDGETGRGDEGATASIAPPSAPSAPAGYRLYGLLTSPQYSRPNRSQIYLTVNGRAVKDRTLTSALLDACRHLLPPRRYPAAVLFLELPGSDVDINVHPTKAEVRFRLPGLIYALFHHAIRQAFGLNGGPGFTAAPTPNHEAPTTDPGPQTTTQSVHEASAPYSLWPRSAPSAPRTELPRATRGWQTPLLNAGAAIPAPARSLVEPGAPPVPQNPALAAHPAPSTQHFRILGQAGAMYIVLEDEAGVKLIDQHALHERILFEQFLARAHGRARGDTQGLLLPETVELSPTQAAVLTASAPEPGTAHDTPAGPEPSALALLTSLGFDLEPFGPRTLNVRGVPAILKTPRPGALVRDVLEALAHPDQSAPANSPLRRGHYRERAAYTLACKGAIKAGERLTHDQMTALLTEFYAVAGPGSLTCPHGRPLAVELNWAALEHGVGRR